MPWKQKKHTKSQTTTGSYARQKTKHPLFDSVHRRIDVPNIEM